MTSALATHEHALAKITMRYEYALLSAEAVTDAGNVHTAVCTRAESDRHD
jgi:hypothetical protein